MKHTISQPERIAAHTYPIHQLPIVDDFTFETTFWGGRESAKFNSHTPEGLFMGHIAESLFSEGASSIKANYQSWGEVFTPDARVEYGAKELILSVDNNGPTLHSFVEKGEQKWWDEAIEDLDVVATGMRRIIEMLKQPIEPQSVTKEVA